jgi:S-adenosylmethionine:tRNA ribosyltransferase-isomerase
MEIPEIDLNKYTYRLPEHRIAQYPLPQRDQSKLLVYEKGGINHEQFDHLGKHLPEQTTLVFNDTKVIPARLLFRKSTGAVIEIFLLEPVKPSTDLNIAMQAKRSITWTCMIGNLKRWKEHQSLQLPVKVGDHIITITANRISSDQVQLDWDDPGMAFVDLIREAGQVPLPPYMKRKADPEDRTRYQTVYSRYHGAVAAPTAGLHFTDSLLESLEYQGIERKYLTLHVGAGTFQPIKASRVSDHPMHGEQIHISKLNLEDLIKAKNLVAVGTTSLRTMESLYWYGVKLIHNKGSEFHIRKLDPYQEYSFLPEFKASLEAVKLHLDNQQLDHIQGYTEIFIFPPYRTRSCQGLITNFHLPASTLILLVAAFVGDDWKMIYQEALSKDYRFLSYGDSSLLLPSIQN